MSAPIVVCCLNGMIAAGVCWLTWRLWRWRCGLVGLNQSLVQVSLSPQAMGYRLMVRRAQIAQTRLAWAQFQGRSQQLIQTLKLIRTLQTILLFYRARRRS